MDHQEDHALKQFIRFNIIGVVNVILTLALYFLLIFLGWHHVLALTAEYAFGICFSFFMNKRFTFRIQSRATPAMFGKMIATYGLLFLGNLGLLVFFVDFLHVNPYLGQIVSFSILMFIAFFMQKLFVFRTAGRPLS